MYFTLLIKPLNNNQIGLFLNFQNLLISNLMSGNILVNIQP